MIEIEKIIKSILAEKIGVDLTEVVDEAYLVNDLGADSLDIVEIIMEMERKLDISIGDEEINSMYTVGEVINIVKEHIQHPEKNITPKEKPKKTSYMYHWLYEVERENEAILSECLRGSYRRRFEDTDDPHSSIYSDIYKYSCGGVEMFENEFNLHLAKDEMEIIHTISESVSNLLDTLDKICIESSDKSIKNNELIDSSLVSILPVKEIIEMRDISIGNIRLGSSRVHTIIKCLIMKAIFTKLKIGSFLKVSYS